MENSAKYLVKIDSCKACLEVVGRATYLNCKPVGEFFDFAQSRGCDEFFIDFSKCTGMDSTFMGMIAGLALKLAKNGKPDAVNLCSLEGRNLELIENLGLDSIVKISDCADFNSGREGLTPNPVSKPEILDAHKNLIEANLANAKDFQDIVKFMQKELERGGQ